MDDNPPGGEPRGSAPPQRSRKRLPGPGGREQRGLGAAPAAPIVERPSPVAVRRREAIFRRSLAAADVAAGGSALVLAMIVVGGGELRPVVLLGLPLIVVSSKLAGLYDRDDLLVHKLTIDELPTLFTVATLITLLVMLSSLPSLARGSARFTLLALWLSLPALMAVFRSAARRYASRHSPTERCLVIGDSDAEAQLRSKLEQATDVNGRVLGYLSLREKIRADDPPPLGRLGELDRVAESYDVHRVIVVPRDHDSDDHLEVVRRAKALGLKVSVVPRIFEVVGTAVVFDDLGGLTMLGVRGFGLPRSSRIVKRGFDLLGATVGVALGAPLAALTAVAIKLDSRGPVLFRQRRVGRDGEMFEIYKFRTMVADAEQRKVSLRPLISEGGLFKLIDDPRITRVGRWLRRTSLDELPQLLNVIIGEMSLVGPRPLVLDEDEQVAGWARRRLRIKPGMTGPWQVLGSGRVPLGEMVKLDYLYVANWSLWVDVKILLRTIAYVLRRGGV